MRLSLLLCAAMASCANGFATTTRRSQTTADPLIAPMTVTSETTTTTALFSKSTATRLQYRNDQDDDMVAVVSERSSSNTIVVPRGSAFLPRAEQERKRAEQGVDVEIMTGRVAMVAAILMFGTEVVSGTSLPDQITGLMIN